MTIEERLYKMLSNYTHIMYCADRDYKPFVERGVEEQISEVYSQISPNVLRDWQCPSCAIFNWKQFGKWYRQYEKTDSKNKNKNHTQNGKEKINEDK